MKTRKEVMTKMMEYIKKAVDDSDEVKSDEYINIAKVLAWVLDIDESDVEKNYDILMDYTYGECPE